MKKRYRRKQRRRCIWRPGPVGAGLMGMLCLVWAAAGFYGTLAGAPSPEMLAYNPKEVGGAPPPETPAYYPMEVGRYWVYSYTEPGSGRSGKIERRIERHEAAAEGELFFYGDGALVYRRAGRVFEMGSGGGVNVIPLGNDASESPYIYRSAGMRIEKSLGAIDTTVVVEGRRYDGCIEVVTRSRAEEGGDGVAYASYYAPGIGLVGRRAWPASQDGGSDYWLALREYGVNNL